MNREEKRSQKKANGEFGNKAPEGMKWIKCVYPPCQEQVLIEDVEPSKLVGIKPKQQILPMCPVHGEMCMFMMWLLPNIRMQQGQTPGGIVVPGSPAAATPPVKLVP